MKLKKILMARELRRAQTQSEKILWQALRNRQLRNLKFHRQYIIAGFILDFYCPALRLGVEIDGGIHNLKDNKLYDIEREKILNERGIKLIRFTNGEVLNNMPLVMKSLKAYKLPSLPEGIERGRG